MLAADTDSICGDLPGSADRSVGQGLFTATEGGALGDRYELLGLDRQHRWRNGADPIDFEQRCQ